jgi:uncharacterized protein (DUF2126 family)
MEHRCRSGIDEANPRLALIQCLREKVAPGALLHYGQGKWYPRRAVPRWALSCYWRADGVPVWENIDLIAREDQEYGFGAADAFKFMEALTRASGELRKLLPAYNPDERVDGAGRLHLPIRRRQPEGRLRWSSQLWFPRPERLMLSVGDSPIGFRIPTESMPWVAPDELEYEFDAAPFEDRSSSRHTPARRMELFQINPAPIRCPLSRAPLKRRRS